MSERFELIGDERDISGHLRLAYGCGPDDPTSRLRSFSQFTATIARRKRRVECRVPVNSKERPSIKMVTCFKSSEGAGAECFDE